jgi:N-acetylmuramoyl-L-alanine amidase
VACDLFALQNIEADKGFAIPRRRTASSRRLTLGAALGLALAAGGCGSGHASSASSTPAPAVSAPAPAVTTATSTTTTTATTTSHRTVPRRIAHVARPAGPLRGKVVVIDPGHNGGNAAAPDAINRLVPAGGFMKACDTTGTATDAGYNEAEFNFDVALRVAAILRREGAHVVLTRSSNDGVGPCVNERAAIGNRAHADAAISIHADGAPASGQGFHVIEPALVAGYNDAIIAASARLGGILRDEMATGSGLVPSTYLGHDGIDVRGDLGGLNLSAVPKVFLESGNMRNPHDAGLQTDPAWRDRLAHVIAAALTLYLTGPARS